MNHSRARIRKTLRPGVDAISSRRKETSITGMATDGSGMVTPIRDEGGAVAALRAAVRSIPGAHPVYDLILRARREFAALQYAALDLVRQRSTRPGSATALICQAPTRPAAFLQLAEHQHTLAERLNKQGIMHRVEGRGIYVPPQPGLEQVLGEGASLYARDAAYWILPRKDGDVGAENVGAVTACNLLYAHNLGPRLYDLMTLTSKSATVDLFVIEAVGDEPAGKKERAVVEAGIAELMAAGEVAAKHAEWSSPVHFRTVAGGQGCDRQEACRYLRFDYLRVPDQASLIKRLLQKDARQDLHFGLENVLRGGRYLYQSVPSVGAGGRRDSARRWNSMSEMLRAADADVADRVVLDIGCNAGMMLAAALGDGAAWGIGWDRPAVARRAREILLALGFTRFDVVGAELGTTYRLVGDVPRHLEPRLDGSIVLYLAIRHHIGYLRELGSFPWRALVYEGGNTETARTLAATLAPLRRLCHFEIAGIRDFKDGETGSRPLAVLIRTD